MFSRLLKSLALIPILFALQPAAFATSATASTDTVMVQLSNGEWEFRKLPDQRRLAISQLEADPGILDVQPVRTYRQLGPSTPPSDPSYPLQWHLSRNEANRSWQFGRGDGVVVAVLDSGVNPISDLSCHTYVSPRDFLTPSQPGVPPDANGHGTFVTSVLAECTDNALYAAGTAPAAKIMPVRVLDSAGLTDSTILAPALAWARQNGAKVVNLSLGFECTTPYSQCNDPMIDAEIGKLAAAGAVVVAAAGNDGGGFLAYPANHPKVIAVGASGHDGTRASYSSGGPGIDLTAPTGDDDDPINRDGVIHQGASGGLEIGSGTSYSAPQVAGAVAILLSAGAPTADAAATALLRTAADIGPSGYDLSTGWGDLRIRQALAWGGNGLTPPIADAAVQATADFDGDGRGDLFTFDGAYGRLWVLRSNGSAFSASQWARHNTSSGWQAQMVGDFSGDGRDDVAQFHPSNGTWWISRSTGSSFITSLWADFATASGWEARMAGDFNGDGRDDIAQFHPSNGTWWISRSNASSFTTSLWADFSTASGWEARLVGDFNGDGRDDIAQFHPSNGTWWISRSTGNGFATSLWADFTTASGWQARLVGDFNGDGRDDIAQFHPSNGTWWISRSTGNGFVTSLWADFTTASGWNTQIVGDFNGDGKDDIANHHRSGVWVVSSSTGTGFTTRTWFD